MPNLQLLDGGAVADREAPRDPDRFQAACVEAFVASWRARGFSAVTIDNDTGLLERTLVALGRPAWEVTESGTNWGRLRGQRLSVGHVGES